MSGKAARDALSHPLVLRGAWLRLDAWYRGADLAPEPELSLWRLHPEAKLRQLGGDLRAGTWAPSEWQQVPYPKKGARLRHYVLPTVEDQVAFMAHMVLLGPLFDSCVETFAFGNRWYRPLVWNRRKAKPRWEFRPYPLLTNKTYRPFASSHGLYKRVANWTISRMTGARVRKSDYGGPIPSPDDYDNDALPLWLRDTWWAGGESDERHAAWATLDIELAYPSVRLDRLERSGIAMLTDELRPVSPRLIGYPQSIRQTVHDPDCRRCLVQSLVEALNAIQVYSDPIPHCSWRPHHAAAELPPDNKGLPTGLAVSGMLLNVALHYTDRFVLRYLEGQSADRRGAFLRFADDMIVLSRSAHGLMETVDAVWRGLAGDGDAKLAIPESRSNLHLGVDKISPEPVRDAVLQYRRDHKWWECPAEGCKHLRRPETLRNPQSLGDWWEKRVAEKADEGHALLRRNVDRAMVGPRDVGPFVTTLVTRMSDIARDTLSERFGEGARNRLIQLHDLARLDIDDLQVRADTRRAFAVNRLVRAWLPGDAVEVEVGVAGIRESIARVLRMTPWKYSVWRAVVQAAARRAPTTKDHEAEEGGAAKWLVEQLRRIAHHQSDNPSERTSWMHMWPEKGASMGHDRDPVWRQLYLSFHRASFWQALASVLRSLWQHEFRMRRSRAGKGAPPPPHWWTVRAVPEGHHAGVIGSLGALDRWVEVLYPGGSFPEPTGWTWELDQFVAAVLASRPALEVAEAWRRSERPGMRLMVPESMLSGSEVLQRTMGILSDCRRVSASRDRAHRLNEQALAHLRLAGRDGELGESLFPQGKEPRILGWRRDATHTLMTGAALGCRENVNSELARGVVEATCRPSIAHGDALTLREYGSARGIVLGSEACVETGPATIHRLLWGATPGQELDGWKVSPWELPAVGLPVGVAVALFASARAHGAPPAEWRPSSGPLTWEIRKGKRVLAVGRQLQFGPVKAPPRGDIPSVPAVEIVRRSLHWEVYPHPAYLLPFSAADPDEVNADAYALYCDILLLLTALDGKEAILNTLVGYGAGVIPLEDRWAWRSRIHLPREAWQQIDRAFRWIESPVDARQDIAEELGKALEHWVRRELTVHSFTSERVDLLLPGAKESDFEIVRTVRATGSPDPELPDDLRLRVGSLAHRLRVRIGQIERWVCRDRIVASLLQVDTVSAGLIMEQVAAGFQSPGYGHGESDPELVVLPEVAVPNSEVTTVRDLVRKTGRASLAGLHWRILSPVYPGAKSPTKRWFVNEAELVLPVGHGDGGPTGVRWYRVRKPVPAHEEVGLARALEHRTGVDWGILAGHRWYRFVHPCWGDFSIAICSDLLDAAPWRSFRGELLHLFMVAFNNDVGLFESLTWVRAYENYVNLVSVNHGAKGGSFVWTPRRSHEREVAQLRGRPLFVLADVDIPVKRMMEEQNEGVKKAAKRSMDEWLGDECASGDFKAPPPGYQRNAVVG